MTEAGQLLGERTAAGMSLLQIVQSGHEVETMAVHQPSHSHQWGTFHASQTVYVDSPEVSQEGQGSHGLLQFFWLGVETPVMIGKDDPERYEAVG